MSHERRVAWNTVVLIGGKGLGDLSSLLFLVFVARQFGAAVLGEYAFGMAVGGGLTALLGLGLNTLLERDVSRAREQGPTYVGSILALQGALGLLVLVVAVVLTRVMGLGAEGATILMFLTAYQLLGRWTGVILAQFAAHQDLHYSALLDAGHRILILACGFALARYYDDPVITLAVYPAVGLVAFTAAVVISSVAYGRPRFDRDLSLVKRLLVGSVSFLLIQLLLEAHDRIGVIILGAFRPSAEVGTFSVADRVVAAVVGAIHMFETALFPALCRLAPGASLEFDRLVRRAFGLMLVTLLPLTVAIIVSSRQIVVIGFGEAYLDAVGLLRLLAATLPFVGLGTVVCTALLASNQERMLVSVMLLALACYGVMSLTLVPLYGATGLAIAKLVAAVLLFVIPLALRGRHRSG